MRKGFCSLSSRSLMARSVSMTRFSKVAFAGFSMLYWSPRPSSFCSSSVKWMSVRLMVRGNDVGCCSLGLDVEALCCAWSLSSFSFNFL